MALPTCSIGAQSFIRIDGVIPKKQQTLSNVTRPQVDGVAYRKDGIQSPVGQIEGRVDVSSAATAEALRASYASMVGTVVTVTRETQSHSNYLILNAEVTDILYVQTPVGGLNAGDHLVTSRWDIQYVGT